MPAKTKAVCLLSGGLDSSTLLYQLLYEEYEPTALIVDYGQRHARELQSAIRVAEAANVLYRYLELKHTLAPIFAGAASSQVGQMQAVPHGHYAAESMKTTIVPNRNMMLIAMAGALAETLGAKHVSFAAHAGDHAIYPDCRPEFYHSASRTLNIATGGKVELYNPFIRITKTDIARRANLLKVPVELTWSCYDPQPRGNHPSTPGSAGLIHCGLCGTCVERREAFRDAKLPDPTEYAA
jgi:7-cyano-7-deazaguanine synthase